jgi:hypothetical protein
MGPGPVFQLESGNSTQFVRPYPIFPTKKKRVQALPFLYAFCPAKSLTRGEENIPQTN